LRVTPEVRGENEETEAPPDMTGSHTYRLPLPPHPIAAEQARIVTKIALAEWNIHHIIDNALIITTELVANAAKLGDVFHLTLSRHGGTVLIEVRDNSEASPDRRRPSTERVDGRGLMLVEACAKDWGWRIEDQGGKTIWATVDDADPPVRM
jgi:hypothetical protein